MRMDTRAGIALLLAIGSLAAGGCGGDDEMGKDDAAAGGRPQIAS